MINFEFIIGLALILAVVGIYYLFCLHLQNQKVAIAVKSVLKNYCQALIVVSADIQAVKLMLKL